MPIKHTLNCYNLERLVSNQSEEIEFSENLKKSILIISLHKTFKSYRDDTIARDNDLPNGQYIKTSSVNLRTTNYKRFRTNGYGARF